MIAKDKHAEICAGRLVLTSKYRFMGVLLDFFLCMYCNATVVALADE